MNRLIGVFCLAILTGLGVSSRYYYFRARSIASAGKDPTLGLKFRDQTRELGIDFFYQAPQLKSEKNIQFRPNSKVISDSRLRLIFLSPGVAVADFNQDGWMDFMIANANGELSLYINQQGKGFKDEAEAWGLPKKLDGIAPVTVNVIDFKNDHYPDVFITGLGCSRLFRNEGGKRFVDVSEGSGLTDCENSLAAVPYDFDGDGLLDLYVLRYWKKLNFFDLQSPFLLPDSTADNRNGGRNTYFHNLGNGKFRDESDQIGATDTRWALDAVIGDFDQSRSPRLYVANDFGADTLYAIKGGKLEEQTHLLGPPDRSNGMNVNLVDVHHDGSPSLYVSNIFAPSWAATENFLKHRGPADALFVEEARKRNIHDCGWAWGAGFADFDFDGEEEAYVANGYVSGGKDYWFKLMVFDALPGFVRSNIEKMPDPTNGDIAGHQIDCLFKNNGGTFERAIVPDMQLALDDRAVGLIDFDNSGSMDLIVTSQNGPTRFFKNEIPANGRFVGVLLEATRSQHDAIGARVRITQNGKSYYRWATGGKSGFLAFSDPRLHFGFPETTPVDIEVSWPNGGVEKFPGVQTGAYYKIVENRGIRKLP